MLKSNLYAIIIDIKSILLHFLTSDSHSVEQLWEICCYVKTEIICRKGVNGSFPDPLPVRVAMSLILPFYRKFGLRIQNIKRQFCRLGVSSHPCQRNLVGKENGFWRMDVSSDQGCTSHTKVLFKDVELVTNSKTASVFRGRRRYTHSAGTMLIANTVNDVLTSLWYEGREKPSWTTSSCLTTLFLKW